MAFNFQQLAMLQKVKPLLDTFRAEHPKVSLFLHAIQQDAIRKDSVMELSVTTPEGKTYTSNIRLTDNDMKLLEMMKNLNA